MYTLFSTTVLFVVLVDFLLSSHKDDDHDQPTEPFTFYGFYFLHELLETKFLNLSVGVLSRGDLEGVHQKCAGVYL